MKKRSTLSEMQDIASSRRGKCLSNQYINNKYKLKWKCDKGHIWMARPDSIKQGSWCARCKSKSKITIEDIQKLAKQKKGECLSIKYINAKTKLKWKCSEGHTWMATPNSIKHGSWCQLCLIKKIADSLRSSIEKMQKLAELRDGVCLSKLYANAHSKLKWKCSKGHVWMAKPLNIKHGSWCPFCKIKHKLNIEDMERFAKQNKGECISKKYINLRTELTWKCNKGHVWRTKPINIKHGSWCPLCAEKSKTTIEDMRKLAKQNKGECISDKYFNDIIKLTWKCSEGHIWEARPDSIKRGSWCALCRRKSNITIKDMQKLAKQKKGECLSIKYINAKTKLKWKCSEGHTWMATPNSIKQGSWCPFCARKKIMF